VRSTDEILSGALAAALPSHVVPAVEAPPNLSFKAGQEQGKVRELHTLYRSSRPVARSRSRGRLLRAAIAHLDGFLDDPVGIVRLDARLVTIDGEAVIVGGGLGPIFDEVARRVERLGYRVIDGPGVALDVGSFTVRRWEPRLDLDAEALAGFLRSERDDVGDPGPATLPLRAIVTRGSDVDDDVVAARRLVGVLPFVARRDTPLSGADVELARRLLVEHDVRTCEARSEDLLPLLRALASDS